MMVRCIAKTVSRLALDRSGKTELFSYSVDVGTEYVVYSIMLWDGVLNYLLSDEYGNNPLWYPAELFEVINFMLPLEWYYNYRGKKDSLWAIWGYKEMVLDTERHYAGVIEWEPAALEIFFRRKKEIDEYEELSKYREKKS